MYAGSMYTHRLVIWKELRQFGFSNSQTREDQKEALEPTSLFSVFMKRQPSENSLVFQQATNDNRGEEESMPVALMILIPILSSGLILIILTVVCIRR